LSAAVPCSSWAECWPWKQHNIIHNFNIFLE
jgi:hypothetical protein